MRRLRRRSAYAEIMRAHCAERGSPAKGNNTHMEKTELSVRDILAGRAPREAQITVKGWVRTRRDSKAGISFIHVSDGSSFHPVQVVAPSTLPNYAEIGRASCRERVYVSV